MASQKEAAPICPTCGRSNGVKIDLTGTAIWRNGKWRWDDEPDLSLGAGDAHCPHCDTYW